MSLLSVARFSKLTEDLSKISNWKPPKLQGIQYNRFRDLVDYAARKSKFYGDKLRGVYLKKVRLDQIPPTTKNDIRNNLEDIFTDPALRQKDIERFMADESNLGKWYHGKYMVSQTSGSEGAPLIIVQERKCLELMYAMMGARSSVSPKPNIIEGLRRLLKPKRVAFVTFRRGFYPSGAGLEFMKQIVGPYVRTLHLSSMQDDLIDRLNEFQPNVIVGYASVLDALTNKAHQFKLHNLQQITNSSEQLFPAARERIEKTFSVPILDHYGMGECLMLADGCRSHQRLHVNADWSILEVVDNNYEPVPPGTVGAKILVTNLANHVQPFIRYEVTDRIALSPNPCACGSCFPLIQEIDGRQSDIFWIGDSEKERFVSGVLFNTAIDKLKVVREWQAIQTERNKIDLHLELLEGVDITRSQLQSLVDQSLTSYGLPKSVLVTPHIAQFIPSDQKTGKQRRMISRLK